MDESKIVEIKSKPSKSRAHEIRVQKQTNIKYQVILTIIISFMLVLVLMILTFAHIKAENKDIFSLITGTLTGAFLTSCGYWFTGNKNERNNIK